MSELEANTRRPWGWKPYAIVIAGLFAAYQSLFVGDAHEIGPIRDKIAGAFNAVGLLPQASGFEYEHGLGGKTTLIHRQMVNDAAYARRMMALTGVEMPPGPEDADWWNVFIIRLVPIDSDLKAAVSFYAEGQLCALDPARARNYTATCQSAATSRRESDSSNASVAAPQVEQQAAQATAPPRARFDRGCEAGSSYYRRIGQSDVICGCDYDYHAESADGSAVCAGGLYDYHAESRDGTMVACGGQYDYHAESRDGNDVCAGGLYNYHVESRNGNDVACGGQYNYHAESRDGNSVCAGGLYNYHVESRNGNSVACGGLYDYTATSRDGSVTCYGGQYR